MNRSFFDKSFKDKNGKITLAQKPNILIIIWIVCIVASRFTSGSILSVFSIIGLISIVLWAILEIFTGVNYFRRLLGLVVITYVIISKF